jgi:hypothetical protein
MISLTEDDVVESSSLLVLLSLSILWNNDDDGDSFLSFSVDSSWFVDEDSCLTFSWELSLWEDAPADKEVVVVVALVVQVTVIVVLVPVPNGSTARCLEENGTMTESGEPW